MEALQVPLPGALYLITSPKVEVRARRRAEDDPGLPTSPGRWQADLMAMSGGVPAQVDAPRSGGNASLLLHLGTYVVRLNPTGSGDAYWIADLGPLRAHHHHRLAQGCLLLSPSGWAVVPTGGDVPRGAQRPGNHWAAVASAWHHLSERRASPAGAAPISSTQATFLDAVETAIEAARRIARDEERSPYPYTRVEAVGEKRRAALQVYAFHLAGGRAPDEGAFVRVGGGENWRGQVTAVTGTVATVRLDARVDFRRLDRPGQLDPLPNEVVYETERKALALLRSGEARNPRLLPAIVDGDVRPIAPTSVTPPDQLDEKQSAAFRAALTVDDVALVLGPPGTGKTRVISEIVRTLARGNRRSLVTSHTHRAVDNVLSRLPREVLAVRVGHEGSITPEGQPYLIDRQASDLRAEVEASVARATDGYAGLEHARGWDRALGQGLEAWSHALPDAARAESALDRARRAVGGPAQEEVDRLVAMRTQLEAALEQERARSARLTLRRDRHLVRASSFAVGIVFAALARRVTAQLAALDVKAASTTAAVQGAEEQLAAAQRVLDAATAGDPGVRSARSALDQATERCARALSDSITAARAATAAVAAVAEPPEFRTDDPATTWHDAVALRAWFASNLPVLEARARLLADWRVEVSEDTLAPELLAYADVIASTCHGAGTRKELTDLDFDVAIVDEAGQVGIADVLVPLVRARRAVLVGDHMQLPPFLDSEVAAWSREHGDPLVRDLLARSAFELLADRLPETHVHRLEYQRRMPPEIAEFISAAFYEGWLRSDVVRDGVDALLPRPLTFVDTACLPAVRRRETKEGRGSERLGRKGYTNAVEADLLVRMASSYHRREVDWAVILPYRAQVAAVTAALVRELGDSEAVHLNVGSVDSFQGGERDVVLYGFTRSNERGNVGFLAELRRANVAFTRARHRLVLVGDWTTLGDATDPGFRDLMRSLRRHVAAHGELLDHTQMVDRLDRLTARGVAG